MASSYMFDDNERCEAFVLMLCMSLRACVSIETVVKFCGCDNVPAYKSCFNVSVSAFEFED